MKALKLSLLIGLILFSSKINAADEKTTDSSGFIKKAWTNSTCRRAVLAAAAMTAMAVSGGGYYNAFNTRYPEGTWKNEGSETAPVWVPEIGESLHLMERISSLSIPRERTMWVHDGRRGYGKIFFRKNRIEYYRGSELVAKSSVIAPESRPYDKDHPIAVNLFDRYDRLIGTISEISDETSYGEYTVQFVLLNEKAVPVARSYAFSETGSSARLSGPWQIEFPDEAANLTRTGWFTSIYHWERESRPEETIDPRLLIFLPALKSYVEGYRR